MKKCTKCGIEKDESEFGKYNRTKDGLNHICKACKREQDKTWASKHRSQLSEATKRWRKENPEKVALQAERRKAFLTSLKKPCVKCGDARLHVIEFHHIDPSTKLFNISHAAANGAAGKESILAEVEKCVHLCANCHAEFHWFYGINPSEPKKALDEYLISK